MHNRQQVCSKFGVPPGFAFAGTAEGGREHMSLLGFEEEGG